MIYWMQGFMRCFHHTCNEISKTWKVAHQGTIPSWEGWDGFNRKNNIIVQQIQT